MKILINTQSFQKSKTGLTFKRRLPKAEMIAELIK